MNLSRLLRLRWRRWHVRESSTDALVTRGLASSAAVRTAVVAVGSTALAEMYADVLRGQGVPAVLRARGAGRGALGGAPVQVDVLVGGDMLARAREILGLDETVEGTEDARKDGQSQ